MSRKLKQTAASTSYGSMDEPNGHHVTVNISSDEPECQNVIVRMAVPNRPMWHFIDEGEKVELYVTFPKGVVGIMYEGGDVRNPVYELDLAGNKVALEPLLCIKDTHCTMFKATSIVTAAKGRVTPGKPVPFSLQYYKDGKLCEATEVTPPNMSVYYEPVWKKLIERDDSLVERIRELDDRPRINEEGDYGSDGPDSGDSHEAEAILERSFNRSTTPEQLAEDDFFLYYTRRTCRPFLESNNPVIKFIRELMVSPLTNFTGLSLYFQLYLVEIFHVKFYTKLGHYLCMPIIVLFMATWFAQFRIVGDYRIEDVSIFILNGTFVFVLSLLAWYVIWGCLYRMLFFGAFMLWPLLVMYIMANMLFQTIVITSYWAHDNELTLDDVREKWGEKSHKWHDVITLAHYGVVWYLNPLLWALGFAAIQALTHLCEEKLPPRVSQTAHWLDLKVVLQRNGRFHFALIGFSQFIFGTLNEFVASPRLLPLLMLRLCYNLGYDERQWMKFRMLVDECLKYGDPAIDYIGRGGARWPAKFRRWNPENLEEQVRKIEHGLSKKQKECLKDPAFLQNKQFTEEFKSYVLLRHRLSKYRVQVLAYGPFTPRQSADLNSTLTYNDLQMKNDFPDDPAFIMFLKEVRQHFAEMEFRFVEECKLNRVLLAQR
ncbi:uncharacterized protein LOC114532723 [Dendronephthya gigantea]|uniref:uncharacterized protein LOC114532723 n=1 Tax=Dendronephthya gigantea TaxID=151771 RepID=UPI00106CCC16|nr:uncharacterized protein LOC114532723 [Dendronephthya gigantea]